jgi:hypothetical protein
VRANVLLIKYPQGYLERADAGRVAAEGRYEAYVEINVEYRQLVLAIADNLLASLAEPWRTTVGFQPSTTAEEPYTGFTVGDSLTYPSHTGSPAQQRVMAVSVTADENGEPIFVPELGVTPPAAPLAAAQGPASSSETFKFTGGQFEGQFGAGGGQGFEGGTGADASGAFSGPNGTGATRTDAATGAAQGGEITFSAEGSVAAIRGTAP